MTPTGTARRTYLLTLIPLILVGCDPGSNETEIRSEVSEVGDTVVVMNHGQPEPVRPDSVTVLWRSAELENPRAMIVANDRLIVADPTRIHILTLAGEHERTVDRDGDGPGEYRSIYALGKFGADTLAVLDARNQRITFIGFSGEYLGDTRVLPTVPYVNPIEGSRLVSFQGGVASLRSENIHVDRPSRTALVWRDLDADTAAVLAEWDGQQWREFGDRMVGADRLFGPQVIVAMAADGRYAVGDGLDYCITSTASSNCRPGKSRSGASTFLSAREAEP